MRGRTIYFFFKSFVVSLLALAVVCPLDGVAQETQARRLMKSRILPLKNADFERHHIKKGQVIFEGWIMNLPDAISAGKGYKGTALVILRKDLHKNAIIRAEANIHIPREWQAKSVTLSVSAWVLADTPFSTFMEVSSGGYRYASAYHSGKANWEYLTVVFPQTNFDFSKGITLSLISKRGISKFDIVRPVIIVDDRFNDIDTDIEQAFRERLTYRKGSRVRFIFVGNSTLRGTGASPNATIPYILQLKLEAMFPGKFEVINYGVGCWSLTNQIVAIKNNFVYKTWCNDSDNRLMPENINDPAVYSVKGEPEESRTNRQKNAVTLKSLKPDVIILASLWNDVMYTLFFDKWPANLAKMDGMPLLNLYYKALYNYMDNPLPENYKIASFLYKLAQEQGMNSNMSLPKDENSVIGNSSFEYLRGMASQKYDFLTREFINRAMQLSDVWLLNLPSKEIDKPSELIAKSPEFMSNGAFLISNTMKESLEGYYHIFTTTAEIEKSILLKRSGEFNIPFMNIREIFITEHKNIPIKEYVNLGYFHDPLHFTYRGNQWIADRIFMEMQERFVKLAGIAEGSH